MTDAPATINPSKYTKAFWIDLFDRSVSTAAQSAIGLVAAVSFNLLKPDLAGVAAVVGTATLLAILKAFAVPRR